MSQNEENEKKEIDRLTAQKIHLQEEVLNFAREFNKLSFAIEDSKKEYKKTKKLCDNIKNEYENARKLCDDIENDFKSTYENAKFDMEFKLLSEKRSLIFKKEALNNEIQKIKTKMEKYKEMEDKCKNTVKQYVEMMMKYSLIDKEDYEILFNEKKKTSLKGVDFKKVFNENYNELIKYIQAYIYDNDHYIYSKAVLKDFFALLCMNDIIVLAGDSGSGKTSLCKEIAKSIGGICHIIPVKPNWTGREDLLGYYNPIEGQYQKTEFLQAIYEAEKDQERLHIICLDEMNIARVEYYFADFLSILEDRNQYPKISLYSNNKDIYDTEIKCYLDFIKSYQKDNEKEHENILDIMQDEKLLNNIKSIINDKSLLEYHINIKSKIKTLINEKKEIIFPKNVRLVGTVNIDETTHYLSPKILDRVSIIKFGNIIFNDNNKIIDEIKEYKDNVKDTTKNVKIDLKYFGDRSPYPPIDKQDYIYIFLADILKKYLYKLGIDFGARVIRQSIMYKNIMVRLFDEKNNQILNNLIRHKILPKFIFETKENDEKIIKNLCDELKKSLGDNIEGITCYNEISYMISKIDYNNNLINYWAY